MRNASQIPVEVKTFAARYALVYVEHCGWALCHFIIAAGLYLLVSEPLHILLTIPAAVVFLLLPLYKAAAHDPDSGKAFTAKNKLILMLVIIVIGFVSAILSALLVSGAASLMGAIHETALGETSIKGRGYVYAFIGLYLLPYLLVPVCFAAERKAYAPYFEKAFMLGALPVISLLQGLLWPMKNGLMRVKKKLRKTAGKEE